MNDTFINEVLRLSNAFRAENGLDPLVANAELAEAAQSHSESMAREDFFNHTGLDGKKPWDRAEDAGYDYRAIAENIAAGQRTPEAVVNGWINSPGHRRNLLNPRYTDLGVGYFNLENDTGDVNYNTYWTQLFGSGDSVPAPSSEPALPVVTPEDTASEDTASEDTASEETTSEEISAEETPVEETPTEKMPSEEAPAEEAPAEETTSEAPKEESPNEGVEESNDTADEAPTAAEDPSDATEMPEMDMSTEEESTEPITPEPTTPEPTTPEPTTPESTTDAETAGGDDTAENMEPEMTGGGTDDMSAPDMNVPGMDDPGMDDPGMDPAMDGDMVHSAEINSLIEKATPTHRAVKNGAWSDSSTWQNGEVPEDGATVFIGEGTAVTYDAENEARIKTIIVEGELSFAPNKDTQLVVETIINAEGGTLNIGSENQSVAADKQTKIIFTSDRGVNTQWDPTQLTKGLISHGEVNIFGADKLDRAELAGNAVAGNNVLTFKQAPTGWQVGDKIVIGGTEYGWNGSDEDNSRFQDEVLTITNISGNEVRFTNDDIKSGSNDVLRFDHTGSRFAGAGETSLYAANISRNVSFETENGKEVPVNQRAHVMLMHNPNVKVFNAGFYDLGRSDKSKLVDDVGKMIDGSQGSGTNPRGRYALHLHEMGVENPNGTAALIKGNAISGSPGWGIVQHQSHAGIESNVVFDVQGAGIVAENGNEIGWWTGNTVIKATGMDYKKAANQRDARERKFDFGFEGDGYWVQGAGMIANKDNVAISSNNSGMNLFGGTLKPENNNRPVTTVPISQLSEDLRSLFPKDQTEVDIRDIPMGMVEGFEAYNGTIGLDIWGHKTNFDGEGAFSPNRSDRNPQELPETAHTGRSEVKDFKLWGNRYTGAKVQYSSNIDLKDGQIFGTNRDRTAGGSGLFSNHATFNSVYDNLEIAGFRQGVEVEYPNTDKDFITTTVKNSTFKDNTYNLGAVGDEAPREGRPDDFGSFVRLENNQFETAENNRAPVARFQTKAAGGLAMTLDASASFDADPLLAEDGTPSELASNGIASYGWDLNNDGAIDRFGRTFEHVFDRTGNREISLKVTDAQGEASTVQQTINVQPSAYGNAFADGDFGAGTLTQLPWKSSSQYSDQGWYVKEGSKISGGVAQVSSPGDWTGFVGQVTRNDKVHRGEQTLSFRMKNVEGTPNEWEKNEVTVTLVGVNGQFDNNAWDQTGPTKIGALPMQQTELVKKVYGGEDGPDSDFFDWKNISMDVDLGKGYDYLMFQVNSSASRDANDMVAIDNVSLTGAANAIPGELIPANTLNPTAKRRVSAPLVSQPEEELTEEPPAEKMPAEKTPDYEKPAEKMPAEKTPDYEKPAEKTPAEKTPDYEKPAAEEPVDEEPIDEAPADETPISEAPPAEEPVNETPIEESPIEESPIDEMPVDEMPVDEMPVAEGPTSPSDVVFEPTVHLSFEEALGQIAKDTATEGMTNNAKLYGGAEWSETGKLGGAIALDGMDGLLKINSSPDINLSESIDQRTVSMWFNADDVSDDAEQVLFEEGGLIRGLNIYLKDDLLHFGGWHGPENGWEGSWVSTDKAASGQWHHVAMVLDASEAAAGALSGESGTLTAYLDGEVVGQTAGSELLAHPDPIGLGNVSSTTRFENGFGFLGNSGLAGAVDEVQVFNDALTSEQVQQLALA